MSDLENLGVVDPAWVTAEQWFMRAIGGAVLLSGVLGIFFGVLENPDQSPTIVVVNGILCTIMILAGLFAGWWSLSANRIENMIIGFKGQESSSRMIAGLQAFIAFLFLLEGFGGNIVMLILGVTFAGSAIWFFLRASRIATLA